MQADNPAPKQLANRTFGLIFAAIFAIIALYPLIGGNGIRTWAITIAGLFAGFAVILPRLLQPLNNLWVKFGLMMHTIINPILMGLVFFLTVFPIGMIMRALGKDPMNRKFNPAADSYWIERKDENPVEKGFKNQF